MFYEKYMILKGFLDFLDLLQLTKYFFHLKIDSWKYFLAIENSLALFYPSDNIRTDKINWYNLTNFYLLTLWVQIWSLYGL